MMRAKALALLFAALPVSAQEVGEPANDLTADHWYNWIGDGPTIQGLRGRTVLVHFFKVEEPEKNGFLTLCKFHQDHAAKGLVILAVASEAKGVVRRMLQDYPLPFPVGAGCKDRSAWGIEADRGQVLIDPRGNVYYRADAANGVWNGKLLKALKGSKRLGARGVLAYRPPEEYSKRWASTLGDLADGELAKGLSRIERVLGNDKSDAADIEEGDALTSDVEAHVDSLLLQIDGELERGEVLRARSALGALAKDLKRHALGARPIARLAELDGDDGHLRELEAAEQYESLVTAFFTRGLEKNRSKFDRLIEGFTGTHAAQKAHAWVQLVLSGKF